MSASRLNICRTLSYQWGWIELKIENITQGLLLGLGMRYYLRGRRVSKQGMPIDPQSSVAWQDFPRFLRARTQGQKGTQICDPLANKCP